MEITASIRHSILLFLVVNLRCLSGGLVSYTMPPPDLPGSANVTLYGPESEKGKLRSWWSGRDSSVLHDGYFGDDVMHEKEVPNYGTNT